MERIHTHGEQLLRPLKLPESEIDDLVAFLENPDRARRDRDATPPAPIAGCP